MDAFSEAMAYAGRVGRALANNAALAASYAVVMHTSRAGSVVLGSEYGAVVVSAKLHIFPKPFCSVL